jgi:hypothetical protein
MEMQSRRNCRQPLLAAVQTTYPPKTEAFYLCGLCVLCGERFVGKRTVKHVPSRGSDVTDISPPWRSTISFEIARPRPAPPPGRARHGLKHRWIAIEFANERKIAKQFGLLPAKR